MGNAEVQPVSISGFPKSTDTGCAGHWKPGGADDTRWPGSKSGEDVVQDSSSHAHLVTLQVGHPSRTPAGGRWVIF